MSKEQIEAKIKAAAWVAASELGTAEAVKLLRTAIYELEGQTWQGPENR